MADSKHRHCVLIVLDTARADAFEPYGAPSGHSPAVGSVASRGWAAGYAAAPSSWTLPSHVGMLLGASHRKVGLSKERQTQPALARQVMEEHADRYLPAVLSRAGWQTTAASTNLWVQEMAGFDIGFDRFHAVWRNRQPSLAAANWKANLRWAREGLRSAHDDGLSAVAQIADDWATAAARGTTRSFLFLNLVECHSPYLPPRPYNDLGPVDRVRAGLDAKRYLGMESVWSANLGGTLPPADALARMRRLYARSIRYMDDWLESFLARLDGLGILGDTVVVVTSDHGENFGEGGRFGHSFSLDDILVRVPFVACGLDRARPARPVSLTALPRLLVDELGVREHPYEDLEWEAAAPVVAEVDGVGEMDDPRVHDAIARWGLGDSAAVRMTSNATSASDGRYKLIRRAGVDALFDLTADPEELHPLDESALLPAAANARRRLRAAVDAAPPPSTSMPSPAAAAAQDDQLAAQMRLLGYL